MLSTKSIPLALSFVLWCPGRSDGLSLNDCFSLYAAFANLCSPAWFEKDQWCEHENKPGVKWNILARKETMTMGAALIFYCRNPAQVSPSVETARSFVLCPCNKYLFLDKPLSGRRRALNNNKQQVLLRHWCYYDSNDYNTCRSDPEASFKIHNPPSRRIAYIRSTPHQWYSWVAIKQVVKVQIKVTDLLLWRSHKRLCATTIDDSSDTDREKLRNTFRIMNIHLRKEIQNHALSFINARIDALHLFINFIPRLVLPNRRIFLHKIAGSVKTNSSTCFTPAKSVTTRYPLVTTSVNWVKRKSDSSVWSSSQYPVFLLNFTNSLSGNASSAQKRRLSAVSFVSLSCSTTQTCSTRMEA